MKVRVEYAATPIRHIAVQCPKCEHWFRGNDISDKTIFYEYEIRTTQFHCPICDKIFGASEYINFADLHIEEVDYPDVYKDCLQRKEVWG